jgi:hypothetical protein
MKREFLLLTTILIFQSVIFPQVTKAIAKETTTQIVEQKESYPIPGSHLLREKEQQLREYLAEHPEINRLAKTRSTAWNFAVGSTYDWWADSLIDNAGQYQVPSTCRKVGTNCYIFVEDIAWGTDQIDQDAVDAIVEAFDNSTPADAPNNDGIYNVDTRVFGTPPNVDSDPKIIILILDIQDGWDGTGGYVAGYFYSANEYPDGDPAIGGTRSNEAEIFYMDCNPADLITDRTDVLNTTAHEFQHMIHWAHDTNESTFVNEGLSEIASYLCGYGLRSSGRYAQNTNVYLFGWDLEGNVLNDYSRAALWTLYLYEQFPDGFLKDLVQNVGNKNAGINAAMLGTGRNYSTTYVDWIIANHLQDKTIDSKWGYDYSSVTKPQATTHYITTATGGGTIKKLAAEYISFVDGTPFKITFTSLPAHNTLHFTMIKTGPSGSVVEDISKDVECEILDFGTKYTKVTFIVYRDNELFDTNQEETYSYTSIGSDSGPQTIELAYDDGEPEGYLKFVTGDSSAVFFPGIVGAKLDSIKVAFRRSGVIQMDISEYDGQSYLRGKNLYGPVQINSPDSTDSYPVPYDNWVTIDLTSANIDATNDFIVSFLIGNNPAEPGIMISSEPDDGVRNSRTYYKSDDTWYYISDSGNPGNIFKYLIRAYVSIGGLPILEQPTITSIIVNKDYIQLSWNPSNVPVEGYNIYRSTSTGFNSNSDNRIASVGNNITTYKDISSSLQANTDYFYRISSFDGDGNESDYSDEVTIKSLPKEYSLSINYPNPFNPSTTFRFSTPEDGLVKFTVHDLLGRVVYSENRNLFAGNYSFTWEGNNMLNQQVVSGVYFLRMEAEGFNQTRKMLMIK